MKNGLLPGEDSAFKHLAAGEQIVVDGETFTLKGITTNNNNGDRWIVQLRYHSTQNNGDKNYCYPDTWERWRESGTWYSKFNKLHKKASDLAVAV